MKAILACASLLALATSPLALQKVDCPNVMASEVRASVGSGGDNQCYIGIVIFGIEIGIAGPHCPSVQFVYPAHQVCEGKQNTGTSCGPEQTLEVRAEKCTCNYFGGSKFGIGLPGCDCADSGSAGTVEDMQTFLCSDVPPIPPIPL